MLIGNLASAASRRGGLNEMEAQRWAESQSDRLLEAKNASFDKLEQLALNQSAADLHWMSFLLRR